jgi:hypothetical protein
MSESARLWTPTARRSIPFDSALVALYGSALIACAFVLLSAHMLHWFVVPVTLCGVLIGVDAVDWFRRRMDIFDPVGIMGLLGFHFFFLAPLLFIYWKYNIAFLVPPDDWRPWVGGIAALNFLGLIVYRLARAWRLPQSTTLPARWRLDMDRLPLVLAFALLITGALQIQVYRQSGGLTGYISIFEERYTESNAFVGMGWIFMISESFPILAMIGFAVYARHGTISRSWPVLILALLIFVVLKILFGGLRGSRSNIVWALFWGVGILHLWVRRVPLKVIYGGVVVLLVFMYLYGFYKVAGRKALQAIGDSDYRAELEDQSGRSIQGVILADLARADIQSFVLYRLMSPERNYSYAWGRTYLGAAALIIPGSIWPDRPLTKVLEGTDLLYGPGVYPARESTRVFGLAGETMLNFGPLLVPLVFVLLGILVGKVRGWLTMWDAHDPRLLLIPFLVNLCFVVLVGDSDNIVFFLIKNGAVPVLVVWLAANRYSGYAAANRGGTDQT